METKLTKMDGIELIAENEFSKTFKYKDEINDIDTDSSNHNNKDVKSNNVDDELLLSFDTLYGSMDDDKMDYFEVISKPSVKITPPTNDDVTVPELVIVLVYPPLSIIVELCNVNK